MGKSIFLLIDTETTIHDHVADFGAIVCDRKGNILRECRALVSDFWEKEKLFYDVSAKDTIWSKKGLERRTNNYYEMLENGQRSLHSVNAINNWLMKVVAAYKNIPILTAYNLPFDLDKCKKSGILLEAFEHRKFCLWNAAANHYAHTKEFRTFVLQGHHFNAPTKYGNMTYKTNAEVMARYVKNDPSMEDEPHTAFEDAKYYELPILTHLADECRLTEKDLLRKGKGYNWRDYQVRDHYKAK